MQKLNIEKLIIVEGKYDKIRLSNIVDADIIAVNGFSVFKDDKLKKTLKTIAKNRGAIILTDSDTAGYRIRVYLSQILKGADVINVMAPQFFGKEKRKTCPSAQGLLGIEGTDDATLHELLSRYSEKSVRQCEITVADLYELGLIGCNGAKERKNELLRSLGVQQNISNKFLLSVINEKYTKNQFYLLYGRTFTEE